ncbi:hypothetical protein PMNALOAF_1591 [Methylobacterium adhaesivum]|jgi:hypothetical protein|uniref:Uncharacterized protein n=1 Tax=Methylobacterium adhaesivum TaxID=333297 RepID=A0ABT8BCZ3_9HYPH|nr:hypothetical protein [Methylobacterium adhaesivum]MDN3589327.1 hypothetical protein [Methylobacterium adhaesivum]GJD30345.1 hypothetical protein PMNALOAF_1591 [Methylobacterium adhaesivum]
MKTGLLGAFVVLIGLGVGAQAATRTPGRPHPVMTPLETAATACFAETILANPAAMKHARAGRWYEAAGVTGFLCRPEVDAMVQAHDALHGRGTGVRYFRTAYTRHLGEQLAGRLQPILMRHDVASAEPAADKAEVEAAGSDHPAE